MLSTPSRCGLGLLLFCHLAQTHGSDLAGRPPVSARNALPRRIPHAPISHPGTAPQPSPRPSPARRTITSGTAPIAIGLVVLLSAIVTGLGAAAGVGDTLAVNPTGGGAGTAGIVGSIVLAVIIFIGFLAGRMARFGGLKQGLAVWLWLVLITIVLAVAGAIIGSRFNVFARLGSVPNLGSLTGTGAIAAVVAAVVALIGALLGGLAGMRYHRKVDRVGLEA